MPEMSGQWPFSDLGRRPLFCRCSRLSGHLRDQSRNEYTASSYSRCIGLLAILVAQKTRRVRLRIALLMGSYDFPKAYVRHTANRPTIRIRLPDRTAS